MSGSAATLPCSWLFACALLFWTPPADAAEAPLPRSTDYYYQIAPLPVPDDIELEVGGLATLPNGNLGVVTRRGDLYIVENPAGEGTEPHFRLFASGFARGSRPRLAQRRASRGAARRVDQACGFRRRRPGRCLRDRLLLAALRPLPRILLRTGIRTGR